VLLGAALALAGCAGEGGVACPAIGWSNGLTVELAEDWPAVDGGSVRIECSSPCGAAYPAGTPLTGTTAAVQVDMTTPDSVVVTVLAADETEVAEVDAALDWVRVGGSERCGGPSEATVTVPAPPA